VMRRRTR